ncbi:hypothetical protein LEMLEM_LOCUS2067, partial [Lemmus lemmus]
MLAGWTGCFSARRSTENSRRKVTVLYGPSPNSSFLPFCFLFLSTSTAIRIFCPGVASSTGGLPLHTHQSLSKKMPYRLACHPRLAWSPLHVPAVSNNSLPPQLHKNSVMAMRHHPRHLLLRPDSESLHL